MKTSYIRDDAFCFLVAIAVHTNQRIYEVVFRSYLLFLWGWLWGKKRWRAVGTAYAVRICCCCCVGKVAKGTGEKEQYTSVFSNLAFYLSSFSCSSFWSSSSSLLLFYFFDDNRVSCHSVLRTTWYFFLHFLRTTQYPTACGWFRLRLLLLLLLPFVGCCECC